MSLLTLVDRQPMDTYGDNEYGFVEVKNKVDGRTYVTLDTEEFKKLRRKDPEWHHIFSESCWSRTATTEVIWNQDGYELPLGYLAMDLLQEHHLADGVMFIRPDGFEMHSEEVEDYVDRVSDAFPSVAHQVVDFIREIDSGSPFYFVGFRKITPLRKKEQ